MQLFLGEKRNIWSKRGRRRKEEGRFWAKGVPPDSTISNLSLAPGL